MVVISQFQFSELNMSFIKLLFVLFPKALFFSISFYNSSTEVLINALFTIRTISKHLRNPPKLSFHSDREISSHVSGARQNRSSLHCFSLCVDRLSKFADRWQKKYRQKLIEHLLQTAVLLLLLRFCIIWNIRPMSLLDLRWT
ncbi:uncharacterized protein LOC125474879 isoform X2 [Pyrus x bretschneideri]|uniref:uncharacterized protein LOC125474879 isoform X2 n=1 Tax=Pyrus x bretschneideri TaxID=225117 RepID=UPI00202EC0AB|nr:uncharacterized protein LOC125474879 isoform X2 [Pyrus x bretschneideri]